MQTGGRGLGRDWRLENREGFRGHYCSFFRQRSHFPFPSTLLLMDADVSWPPPWCHYRTWHHPPGTTTFHKAALTPRQPPRSNIKHHLLPQWWREEAGSEVAQAKRRTPTTHLSYAPARVACSLRWMSVPGDPLLVFAPKVHCQWMGCITLTQRCNRNFFDMANWQIGASCSLQWETARQNGRSAARTRGFHIVENSPWKLYYKDVPLVYQWTPL